MTLEEQRDYWIEQYNKQWKENKRLKNDFELLIKEMYKNGDMYWAGRIEKLL